MKKASIVLGCYLVSLLVISVTFSWLGIKEFKAQQSTFATIFHPMMIATIVVGLVALRFVVSAKSFRAFVIVYSCLWLLRFPVNYLAIKIGTIDVAGKGFHFDWLTFRYYDAVTRITTPLPFIIYWFINYFIEFVGKTLLNNSKPSSAADTEEPGNAKAAP